MSSSTPTPTGTRAILLPVAGAPVEIWIPLGDGALDAMQKAVGGHIERGVTGESEHGTAAFYFDEEAMLKDPRPAFNANMQRLRGPDGGGPVFKLRGPILVVLEDDDEGDLLSIPDSVAPADWATLFIPRK